MAQNPSFPWVPSKGPLEPENRNESPQRQRLRAVFSAFRESGAGTNLALDILLHELTEEGLAIPGVTGAAIALRSQEDHFVCRAFAGEPAPAMGARIEAQDGLSAECVRTGQLQVCQDTETDARLDAEMCHAWGVRSLVIVPVFLRQKLVGILEVFSPIPDAFDRTAIERLVQLGKYVVETVAFSEGQVPPPAMPARAPVSFQPRIEAIAAAKAEEQPVTMAETKHEARYETKYESKHETHIDSWTDTATNRWIDTQLSEAPVPRHLGPMTGIGPTTAPKDPARGVPEIHSRFVPPPTADPESREMIPPQPGAPTLSFSPSFSAPEALPSPPLRKHPQQRNLGLALLALAAGFVAVVGLWSWWPSPESTAVSASGISGQVPRTEHAAGAGVGSSSTDRRLSLRAVKPSPSAKATVAGIAPSTTPSVTKTNGDSSSGGLVVYERGKVVFRALPGSRFITGPSTVGASAISTSPTRASTTVSSPTPSATGPLANGPVTSAAETEKLRDTADVTATISGGKLIREVQPVMPPEVAGLNLPREVLLEGVIDRDGSVRDLRLLRGDARLAAAAIDAVRQWRYEPFRSNGEKVDMLATLSVQFR